MQRRLTVLIASALLFMCMGATGCVEKTPPELEPSIRVHSESPDSEPSREAKVGSPEIEAYPPLAPDDSYFAYVDEFGFPSIYNLTDNKVVWKSAWPQDASGCGPLSWSADGRLLVLTCGNPSDGKQYIGLLDTIEMEARHVSMDDWFWLGVASWEWSPSAHYLAVLEPGYPNGGVAIVDVRDCVLVKTYAAWDQSPVWSSDENRLAYSVSRGPANPPQMYYEIYTFDLEAGEDVLVFTSEPGCSAGPEKWTGDGALIYSCHNEGVRALRDTSGRTYEDSPEYRRRPTLPPEQPPEQFWKDLEARTGWDKNSRGEWLVSGGDRDTPHWIQIIMPGAEQSTRIVKGDYPTWRPSANT